MWVYCTGADSPGVNDTRNIVLFEYQPGHSGRYPVDYLCGFDRYLQVDGYIGYHQTNVVLVGCWAHASRYFHEAKKAQVSNKTGKADWALNQIQKFYRVEKQIQDKPAEARYAARQQTSKPLVEQFKKWLDKSAANVLPKTLLGKAIQYSLNQWKYLSRYLEHGMLQIDHNRAERAIKPFVIGQKNWLFSNTENGANASAMLYSIVETAKANGLVPYDYLSLCLEHLSKSPRDLDAILPWVLADKSDK